MNAFTILGKTESAKNMYLTFLWGWERGEWGGNYSNCNQIISHSTSISKWIKNVWFMQTCSCFQSKCFLLLFYIMSYPTQFQFIKFNLYYDRFNWVSLNYDFRKKVENLDPFPPILSYPILVWTPFQNVLNWPRYLLLLL